jgi:hypothetical protein
MSTNSNATFSREDWHLVYIRLNDTGSRRLAIRIESTRPGEDLAHWFFPDYHSGTVRIRPSRNTLPQIVHELGWFKDVTRFTQICEKQPVPAGGQKDDVFDLWISELLLTLAKKYQDFWTPNDGCS